MLKLEHGLATFAVLGRKLEETSMTSQGLNYFFVGCKPWTVKHLSCPVMISINALQRRPSGRLNVNQAWMLDSGAFTAVSAKGGYPSGSIPAYAKAIAHWSKFGKLVAVVSQDYMCEPFVLAKTGLTVAEHQRFSLYRYRALLRLLPRSLFLMPVLQGFEPQEYVDHLRMYGDILGAGHWVGVGSVCKRNSDPGAIAEVLAAIKGERGDLRLHGFGLKKTALTDERVKSMLYSADSFAWSYHARKHGRNADDPLEAMSYYREVVELNTTS